MSSRKNVSERTDREAKGAVVEPDRPDYEQPQTVRLGAIKDLTQGRGTASLDGPYGPGWQQYET